MSTRRTKILAGGAAVLGVMGAAVFPVLAQAPATPGPAASQVSQESVVKYWLEPPPSEDARPLERGRWLYRTQGCFLCHGAEGQGGVSNRNYLKDTVPALNTLADSLRLFQPEDIRVVLDLMNRGTRLETLADSPPVPQYDVVVAQYHSVRDVIRNGNAAGRKNPRGPLPPLTMPACSDQLSEADIDALIAHLLHLSLSAVQSDAR